MNAIVGLGNPGPAYHRTWHNLGFAVVDELARRWGAPRLRRRLSARLVEVTVAGRRVVLAQPLTFMNDSGRAVGAITAHYRLAGPDLLLISDDLDLGPGQVRLRPGGSAGGHRGVESVLAHLREPPARLRIGIGRPPAGVDPVDWVLAPADGRLFAAAAALAADAAACWLELGLEAAMNTYNGRVAGEVGPA